MSFLIARYPVTNCQFQAFVAAKDGYRKLDWWKGITRRPSPPTPRWTDANHPQENVTWYDAVAFCRWLTQKYREQGMLETGKVIRLAMTIKPQAFVAMPFGAKPGPDGQLIDFNRVYDEYIKPALGTAGLEPFRAKEETRAGDIRIDMFQELLITDLVVADLTLNNPNVWYELGVRYALRSRACLSSAADRSRPPLTSIPTASSVTASS